MDKLGDLLPHLDEAIKGGVGAGRVMGQTGAGMIKEIKPVKAIIEETVAEAEAIIAALRTTTGRNDGD